jgi:hypothetical protein
MTNTNDRILRLRRVAAYDQLAARLEAERERWPAWKWPLVGALWGLFAVVFVASAAAFAVFAAATLVAFVATDLTYRHAVLPVWERVRKEPRW